MGKKRGILRARKGAVLVEFIIAFMPICAMFLCLCQLSRLAIARLVVQHAAMVSVRACAVVIEQHPSGDDMTDGQDTDVATAAHVVMKPFGGSGTNGGGSEINIDDPQCTHSGEANGGMDTVTVNAHYQCTIPLAKNIVCSSGPKTFTITAQFPHQGSEYEL